MREKMREKFVGYVAACTAWMKTHIILTAAIVLAAIPVFFLAGVCIAEWKIPNLREFCTDQWIGLVGGLLSYFGTCGLGILAFWQNTRYKKENDRFQKLSVVQGGPTMNIEVADFAIDPKGVRVCIKLYNWGKSVMLGLEILSICVHVNENKQEIDAEKEEKYREQVPPGEKHAVRGKKLDCASFQINGLHDKIIITVKVVYYDAEGNRYTEEMERTIVTGSRYVGQNFTVLGRRTIFREIQLAIDNKTCKFN